jgi:hypothetical protein
MSEIGKDLYDKQFEAIADQFDLEQFEPNEESINLGSIDEALENLGISIDEQNEYTIDEINMFLEPRGMQLDEDHTQLFLTKYNPNP